MKIRTTLFLAFAACATLSLALAALISNLQLQQAIDQYTQDKVMADFDEALTLLSDRYAEDGSWDSFKDGDVRLMPFVVSTLENPVLYGLAERPNAAITNDRQTLPRPGIEGWPTEPQYRVGADQSHTVIERRLRPRPPKPDTDQSRSSPREARSTETTRLQTEDTSEAQVTRYRRPLGPLGPIGPNGLRKPPRNGFSLLDANKELILDGRADIRSIQLPIIVRGDTVGYLEIPDKSALFSELRSAIIKHQRNDLPLLFTTCMLITGALALLLSRRISRPIISLGDQATKLAQGRYDSKTQLHRKDELGNLSKRLDELASVLNDHEQRRKSWLADISHELRTPVSILRGEVEAVLDGIRPLGMKTIESLERDITHLQRLIEDLYQLSDTDLGGLRYRKTQINLEETLQSCVYKHQHQFSSKGLIISLTSSGNDFEIEADEHRMVQVLDNVLTNSYKYTDAPGKTEVSIKAERHGIRVYISDSSPGVSDDALPRLFDHLYRAERSRNKHGGGSGLGLAICQHIVDAHQGSIKAHHSPLGGVSVEIYLPR